MVMDYNGYGSSRKEQERFYGDLEKKKQEIRNMEIDEKTKEDLLSQTNKLADAYEKRRISDLNSRILEIRAGNSAERLENASKTIVSKLSEINDNIEHWKKMNISGKHLMDGNNSYS